MVPKEDGDVGFGEGAARNAFQERHQLVVGGADVHAVQAEEHQRAGEPRSRVAVDERVILRQVKQICRALLPEAPVKQLVTKGRAGHGDGRLQTGTIPKAVRTTVPIDLVGMDREHLVQGQEGRHRRRGVQRYFANRRNAPAYS